MFILPLVREVSALDRAYFVYTALRRIVREEDTSAVRIFVEGKTAPVCGYNGHLIYEFQYIQSQVFCDDIRLLLRNPHIAVPSAAVATAEALKFDVCHHDCLI